MRKALLLIFKILAAIIVAVTGYVGIVYKLTDDAGVLTQAGRFTRNTFIVAFIVAVLTSILEYLQEKKDASEEKDRLADNIAIQNKILIDIDRSFYAINSIDILISVEIPIKPHSRLESFKKPIEKFITEYLADKEKAEKEFPKENTPVILNSEQKLKDIHPIYAVIIRKSSPLFPKNLSDLPSELNPLFSILLTESADFNRLNNLPDPPIPDLYLQRVSNTVIMGPTIHEDELYTFSYYPALNKFGFTLRNEKARILHDDGRIVSIKDLPGKYVALYYGHPIDDFEVKELRLQFNKSESKNYNSLFSLSDDNKNFRLIKGNRWWTARIHRIQGLGNIRRVGTGE